MSYQCVILFRYSNGSVGFIYDSEEADNHLAVFANRDAAIAFTLSNLFLASVPYQIVELDEL